MQASHFEFDSKFFVALATIVFFILILRPAKKFLGQFLQDKQKEVVSEIEEAKRINEEAKSALATANRKLRDAEKESADILLKAKHQAESIRQKAEQDLQEEIERKHQLSLQKIKTEIDRTIAKAKQNLVEDVFSQTEKSLSQKYNKKLSAEYSKDKLKNINQYLT